MVWCRAKDLDRVLSVRILRRMIGRQVVGRLTGKTIGMPPLTGLLPSSLAASLSQSLSMPAAFFHEMTVAPKRSTSTDSPVGSLAETRELETSTAACGGKVGVDARGLGLWWRSTMFAVAVVVRS